MLSFLALMFASNALAQTPSTLPVAGTVVSGPPSAICTQTLYNVTVPPYAAVPWASTISTTPNQTVITAQFQEYTMSSANFSALYENPMNETYNMPSTTFHISGTLCQPIHPTEHDGVVQLLVHGVTFDSSYWDFSYEPETYSYVWAAAAAGHTTFRYDRLGTGLSEYPADGYRVVQAPTDLAILAEITSMLRSGSIGGAPCTKIVAIGHSYGSFQVEALAARYPAAADATILTGYSAYSSGMATARLSGLAFSSAAQVDPYRFARLPSAYLLPGVPQALQLEFWYVPYYDPIVFSTTAKNVQPVTVGVMLTEIALPGAAYNYTNPVFVVTGAHDWAECAGNCFTLQEGNLNLLQSVKPLLFPNANVSTYSPALTGHNLNLHYSAPQTYAEIFRWIDSVGL